MEGLAGQFWVVVAVLAGVGVLSVLHAMASSLHNATYVHDMRVRVATLRKEQAERVKALNEAADAVERESLAFAAKSSRKVA